MHRTPSRIGLVGDVHGSLPIARIAIERLAEQGVRDIHFLGDWGFLWRSLRSHYAPGAGTPGADRSPRSDGGSFIEQLGPGAQHELGALTEVLDRAGAIAWVTGGNHENYDVWDAVPRDTDDIGWVTERIALLPRGWRAVTKAGTVLASLGGANSIDRFERAPGRSWWPQESITDADLAALGTEPVDVLIGHDCPRTTTLLHRLIPNEHHWNPRGLEYAHDGHRVFQRAVEQVRPHLTIGGHYHLHVDTTEEFTDAGGDPFTCRCVTLQADGHWPTYALLDLDPVTARLPRVAIASRSRMAAAKATGPRAGGTCPTSAQRPRPRRAPSTRGWKSSPTFAHDGRQGRWRTGSSRSWERHVDGIEGRVGEQTRTVRSPLIRTRSSVRSHRARRSSASGVARTSRGRPPRGRRSGSSGPTRSCPAGSSGGSPARRRRRPSQRRAR